MNHLMFFLYMQIFVWAIIGGVITKKVEHDFALGAFTGFVWGVLVASGIILWVYGG